MKKQMTSSKLQERRNNLVFFLSLDLFLGWDNNMKPLKHQEKFAKDYTGKNLIVHEGGSGKTVCACLWLKDKRDNDGLVICPKKVVRKWQNELTKWGTKATVISKEDFKKIPHKKWSALVVDEADEFASPLFIAKKRSQLSSKLYEQIMYHPDVPILLLTATPVRSNPWNLHTLLTFAGHYIEWKKWRDHFFDLKRMPYLSRPAYIPKPEWRKEMRKLLEKHADIVLLKDCIGELPPVTEEKILMKTKNYVEKPEDKVFFDEHRHEQQDKAKEILDIAKKYRKVLVIVYYREQILDLEKKLSKDRDTFIVYGDTKNQEDVIKKAQESDECFFICQSSIGQGFDLDSFSCGIFVSMSYAVRDWIQMKFRMRRIHNLHPIKYYYLIGGRCDKAILSNIEKGKDFSPSEWI